MRKRLQIALMAVPALAISFTPLMLRAEGAPDPDSHSPNAISVSEENGKKVYVNDVAAKPARRKRPAAKKERGLLYWSVTEHRYKPVLSANGSLMRAARSAAAEVQSYLATGTYRPAVSRYSSAPRYFVSSEQVNAAIEEAAARHDVDPNLVRAVVKVESNFNSRAVSPKGAMGLMQLMPSTARELNVSNPFDPHQNVDAGVRHLKHLLNSYGGDIRLTLAAYNAGQGAVERQGGVPHFRETQDYVKRITNLYWHGDSGSLVGGPRHDPVHMFRDPQGVWTITNTD